MALFSRKPTGPVKVTRIGMHWDTEDPFIFASHHEDDYPAGNRQQAPPLQEIGGRDLGRDYEKRLGYRMYHGKVVPGFPMHAHWGYETITLAEVGYVDHFDNMGIEGRFGFGDVQWVCASSRYSHCEMYPLADQENRNPNDITQIMLNLPNEMKNGENSVRTVWASDVKKASGDGWTAKVICGSFGGVSATSPGSLSWSHGDNGVRIIRFSMDPGSELVIDPALDGAARNLYFVSGKDAVIMGVPVEAENRVKILGNTDVTVMNGDEPSILWLLEGRPIGQKMASFGPVYLPTLKDVRAGLDEIRLNEYHEWPSWTDPRSYWDCCQSCHRFRDTALRPESLESVGSAAVGRRILSGGLDGCLRLTPNPTYVCLPSYGSLPSWTHLRILSYSSELSMVWEPSGA